MNKKQMFSKKSLGKSLVVLTSLLVLASCSSKATPVKDTSKSTETSTEVSTSVEKKEITKVDWPYYEIKKDNQVVGHLLGTMHIGVKEMYPFPEQLVTQLTNSDLVITEVPIADLVEPDVNLLMAAIGTDEPLTAKMNAKSKKLYLERLEEHGYDEKDFEAFNRLGVDQMLQAKYFSPLAATYGVEMKLNVHMKSQPDLKNIGFETVEEQYEILQKVYSEPEDINEWVKAIPALKDGIASNEELMQDYIKGTVFEYFEEEGETGMSKEQEKTMLDDRNENWITQLPSHLDANKHVFVAVGAGHLPGDKGLLTLLKEAGYETKKVTFN